MSLRFIRLLGNSLGTHRFQRAVMGGKPIGVPQRAWNRMRAIASDNHSMQARRLQRCLIPDQYFFPHYCTLEAMRTQGLFSLFQGIAHCDMSDSATAIAPAIRALFFNSAM